MPRFVDLSAPIAPSPPDLPELLRVSGAIAAFGGVYYAIAVLTDSTYREEFLEDIVGELRETFRLRTEYLKLRGSSPRT